MTAVQTSARQDDVRVEDVSLCDPDGFAVVFDRYFAEIHGYVERRLGRDVADDIAAETFLAAFRQCREFDAARGTVRAWLYGIATRQLIKHRRQEVRAYRAAERVGVPRPEEGHAERVVARVDAGSVRRELAAALAELSHGDREVLLLVAIGGLTHAEVAAALGIPYGTVGSRLSRVRRKLRGLAAVAQVTDQEDSADG